jgi:hypothetical protein
MDEPRHWVRIQRRILGGSLWADLHGSRIFLYLILAAEWREGAERGTVWTTRAALAEANHCTVGELEAALRRLRRRKRIETTRERSGMRIKVANYDRYQQWKRDPAQASKPRAKAPRAAAPPQQAAPGGPWHDPLPPRVATETPVVVPTEIVRAAWWRGRKDLEGLAAKSVRSLSIPGGETRHPLEWLTADELYRLCEIPVVRWFRRQLSHPTPVFQATQVDLAYAITAARVCADKAPEARRAAFAQMVANQTPEVWRKMASRSQGVLSRVGDWLAATEGER